MRKRKSVVITNPRATSLPRTVGTFDPNPAPAEPVRPLPRARLGERVEGKSAKVTAPAATYTTKGKGGSA